MVLMAFDASANFFLKSAISFIEVKPLGACAKDIKEKKVKNSNT
jgi:hypothetical protein